MITHKAVVVVVAVMNPTRLFSLWKADGARPPEARGPCQKRA
jgi:hypothetical protein